MIENFIPPFNFNDIFIEPWTYGFESYIWIFLMGFFVNAACGLVGNFIILRRMALVGDAISHSLLPGIALAFILSSSRSTTVIVIGAISAGLLTTIFIEYIYKTSRVKADAAIGIVFSTFFAIGVILITMYADHVDLDADCVLYGEIGFIPFDERASFAGINLGPIPVVRMAGVTIVVLLLINLFYKELLVTSFDVGLANSLGINTNLFHYGLMAVLSVVIVSAFESVGAILVIAMLIFPGATASLISHRLPITLGLSLFLSILYSLIGVHLAIWLNCSIAGAMVVVAGLIFTGVWLFNPTNGLIKKMGLTRKLTK